MTTALAHDDSVVLVGTKYEANGTYYYGKSHYEVGVVDCGNPSNPQVTQERVDVEPYYGYYPIYWGYEDVALAAPGVDVAPWWQPWRSQDVAFILGDTLALRCTATSYDSKLGAATPTQGIAVVDLASTQWTSTLGLGWDGIISVDQAAGNLIVGTREEAGRDGLWPVCAYFVTEVNVNGLVAGPTVNVPGSFEQYDPAHDVLLLRDDQWTTGGNSRARSGP